MRIPIPEGLRTAMIQSGVTPPYDVDTEINVRGHSSTSGPLDPTGAVSIEPLPGGLGYKFNDWKTGKWGKWHNTDTTKMSEAELETYRKMCGETRRESDLEKESKAYEVAGKAIALLEECPPVAIDNRYFAIHKGLGSKEAHKILVDAGVKQDSVGRPLCPVMGWGFEDVINCQTIPTKPGETKRFMKGGKTSDGHLWLKEPGLRWGDEELDDYGASQTFLLVEGVATGVTVQLVTDHPVCVCYSGNNLEKVAECVRELYPKAKIVIAGDAGKAGRKFAKKAVDSVRGRAIFPQSKAATQGDDFNDLMQSEGLEEVARQLAPERLAALFEQSDPMTGSAVTESEGAGFDKAALLAHVEEMNETFASVLVGGKHKIMRVTAQKGQERLEFFSRRELELLYANTLIQVGKKAWANHIKAWATHSNARTYLLGIEFRPGHVLPPECYNTWRGFSVQPKQNKGLLTLILDHILLVICGGDDALYNYVLKWIAYTFQYPARPAGAALVLRGEKGVGKGLLGHFLEAIWGCHGLHIANAKHLVGNFNNHLADICFLFADEAFYSGDKQHEGVLKALVTEPSVMVERKGIDAVSQPNYLKIFMSTNADFAIPASRDERRWCVCDVSSIRKDDRQYFNALKRACGSQEVQSAFLYEMLNLDLTGFHTGDIPESAGLRDQRYHSMDSVQKWIAQCLINESFEVINGDAQPWQDQMTSNELYAKYEAYCDSGKLHEYRRVAQCKMATYLGKIFEKIKRVGGADLRGYYFGAVEDARRRFENYEKVNLNELM